MAHSRSYDKTVPGATDLAGEYAQELRNYTEDLEERLDLDHFIDNELDTTKADADGRHKRLTLKTMSSPSALEDAIRLYTKDVGGKPETHIMDEEGNEIQLTSAGNVGVRSEGANGHLKLGALTIQWGSFSNLLSAGATATVTFSTAFITCYNVTIGEKNSVTGEQCQITAVAGANFTIKNNDEGTQTMAAYYIAVGI